ncbi:MAG: histidine kinase, partial [Proteobacteria bacterium]
MGVPLFSREGEAVGTLCVVDNVPRELTEKQKTSLERLALVTVQLLESHQHAKAQLDAELILEKERGFLAAVLDNLADGVVACNAEGKLTLFNRALKKFHGLDPNGNLDPSKWSDYYKLYQSDGKTPMQMKDVPLFRSFDGEQIRDVEMVIVHTTGVTRRLLASGTPLFSKDGQKLGAVCAM